VNRCIGIMFQNEEHWLSLHLPNLISDDYEIIMLDGGSTDNSAAVADHYADHVGYNEFVYDWSRQVNTLSEFALKHHYKYMLRLDPDELMFRDEINKVFDILEYDKYKSIALPRFNFERDRQHWCSNLYPDWQSRAYEITEVSFTGKVHEQASLSPVLIDDYSIYHYEGLNNMPYRTLKGLNYSRIAEGLLPLEVLPREIAATPMAYRLRVPFIGRQPVEFKNIRAPFGD